MTASDMKGKTLTVLPGESWDGIYVAGAGNRYPSLSDMPEKIVMCEGAIASFCLIVLPGTSGDFSLAAEMAGRHSEISVSGLYLCASDERVNISVDLLHNVPECTSVQMFRGIAGGTARADFYGKITVAADAQKTDASQENHNLLLSDGARVNTRPQLEIYADDVKCSHGATVGYLNEDEQFYMRSRGISLEDAKMLQMISFVSPVLDKVRDGALRKKLLGTVGNAVRKFAAL